MLGKIEGGRRRAGQGMRWFDGITDWMIIYKFEQAPGAGDGQGGLACCGPWGHRLGHDWATELNHLSFCSVAESLLNLSRHQGLFQWVGSSHQVVKVLEYSIFSISPSSEYSGLISLQSKGLSSPLQHHKSKASSAIFIVQLAHPHMTTGKTIALTI